jgi:hypothetical protein
MYNTDDIDKTDSEPTATFNPILRLNSVVNNAQITLVPFYTTPFPFHGTAPSTPNKSFLDVNNNGRLGHVSMRHGILWEDETYSDRRVLLSVPKDFKPSCPLAIVVFLHGNEATLERDVRDRQGVVRQLVESGLNSVLVAPQFAVDARDSSAGRFWEVGVFHEFLCESARRLSELHGIGKDAFEQAPAILVAYSGGYLPAAAAIRYGQAMTRIRGIVLLDAVYGELDTSHDFIIENCKNQQTSFFLSVYGRSSRDGNEDFKRRLIECGMNFESVLRATIEPGSVTFIDVGDTIAHRDFVTQALNGDPMADILSRLKKIVA